jgi:hypothetical protein
MTANRSKCGDAHGWRTHLSTEVGVKAISAAFLEAERFVGVCFVAGEGCEASSEVAGGGGAATGACPMIEAGAAEGTGARFFGACANRFCKEVGSGPGRAPRVTIAGGWAGGTAGGAAGPAGDFTCAPANRLLKVCAASWAGDGAAGAMDGRSPSSSASCRGRGRGRGKPDWVATRSKAWERKKRGDGRWDEVNEN